MNTILKADPTFTNFVPKTAAEAVDRYVRCRRNGLKPMLVPECLITCARGLPAKELDLFEEWIINPNGSMENVELVPEDSIRLANDAVYRDNLRRFEDRTPPLPAEDEKELDEKLDETDSDDEKIVDIMGVPLRGMCLSPAVPPSTPAS